MKHLVKILAGWALIALPIAVILALVTWFNGWEGFLCGFGLLILLGMLLYSLRRRNK